MSARSDREALLLGAARRAARARRRTPRERPRGSRPCWWPRAGATAHSRAPARARRPSTRVKASSVRGPPPGARTVTAQSPPSAATVAAQLLGGQRIRDVDHPDGAARKAADRDRPGAVRREAQQIRVGAVRVRVAQPDDVDQAEVTSSPPRATASRCWRRRSACPAGSRNSGRRAPRRRSASRRFRCR